MMPFFIELRPGRLVRIQNANVSLAEVAFDTRIFLTGLSPACYHTHDEQHGQVRSSKRGAWQHRAEPMREDGPCGRGGRSSLSIGSFDSLPDRLLKAGRQRSAGPPLLEEFAERFVM